MKVSYIGVMGQQETVTQECLAIPSAFLRPGEQGSLTCEKWIFLMTQCERDPALSSTCLTVPQRSRKIFVASNVATQQHEETSCALETPVIPLGEEKKEDN